MRQGVEKMLYELRPVLLAAVGAFGIVFHQSAITVVAGFVVFFGAGVVLGLRLQYQKSAFVRKDIREYFKKV